MYSRFQILYFAFLPLFLFLILYSIFHILSASAAGITDLKIEILFLCGNNIKEKGEQCDGADLGGASCANLGYAGGALSCNANCTFNTSACASVGEGVVTIYQFPSPPKAPLPTCDFNGDSFCNFKDLSILLFWFGKSGPKINRYDLNNDKKINFVDVSILLYRWKE